MCTTHVVKDPFEFAVCMNVSSCTCAATKPGETVQNEQLKFHGADAGTVATMVTVHRSMCNLISLADGMLQRASLPFIQT